MEDILIVTTGEGSHTPSNKRNTIPVDLELCADSRRAECPYYIKVNVNTKFISFYQGFCSWGFRKGPE